MQISKRKDFRSNFKLQISKGKSKDIRNISLFLLFNLVFAICNLTFFLRIFRASMSCDYFSLSRNAAVSLSVRKYLTAAR